MPLKQTRVTGESFPQGEPDVQRTSLSLDVLGRFICNTYEEATANPDFDVVVIGSGMYGGYCAAKVYSESEAAGRPLRVLVLEAGPFLVAEHGQNIPNLGLSNPFRPVLDPYSPDAQKPRDLVWGMGWRGNTGFPGTAYCVGGKSIYWGGWCPRLRARDLAQWPSGVRDYLTGPPPSTNMPNRPAAPSAKSVYEAVEFEIGVKPADDFVFDPILGPEGPPNAIGLNAALGALLKDALAQLRAGAGTPLGDPEPPPIAVQTQSFVSGVFSPDKFSSLPLLTYARRQESGRPDREARLFIVPNAHVSKLLIPAVPKDGARPAGYRPTGIEMWVDGLRRTLPVKSTCTVVLALGCIESTRLALESFPTAPDRPNNDEIMGRNLMAHLRFDFQFSLDRQRFREWVLDTTGKALRDHLQTASFHLQADTPDGRFHFQVYAAGDAGNNAEGLLYRMIPDTTVAQRLAAAQDPNKIDVIFRGCGEMIGDRAAPVHTPGTSWIDLAKSPGDRDAQFDHARAYVHYADQGGAAIWGRMREAAITLARQMGAEDIPSEDRHEVGSTWHDSGTLFMGDDPGQSVTDICGHFHNIANVACVDQALFPTVGSANPVLTGLCLSRRVAETIVGRHVSAPELTADEVAAEKAEGFVFLLEGANASKWRPNRPALTATRPPLIVNDTVIEVHGEAGLGVLFYDDPTPFVDFELRLQWKAFPEPGGEPTANSGVFLRAPRPPADLNDDNFYDRAVEIQIDDTGYDSAARRFRSPLHRTGAIYRISPARVRSQKAPSTDGTPGFWNEFRITARGTRVTVLLNGLLCSEGDLPQDLNPGGLLALQYHTGKVQFRSLRVRRM